MPAHPAKRHLQSTPRRLPEAEREARDLDLMADRVQANASFDAHDLKYMQQRAWDSRRSREAGKERYSR